MLFKLSSPIIFKTKHPHLSPKYRPSDVDIKIILFKYTLSGMDEDFIPDFLYKKENICRPFVIL